MATETSPDLAEATASTGLPVVFLFGFRAKRDERLVAEVVCVDHDSTIRVIAEIVPVRALDDSDPLRQFHVFPNRKEARQFVDEAMIALEYLGCIITSELA